MTASSRPAPSGAPRALIIPGLAALLALAVLVSLGTWQLSRLAWKNALIAQVAARTTAPPEPLPPPAAWAGMSPEADEYRRVALAGTFRHDREAYLYFVAGDSRRPGDPGRLSGQGYLVLTPLALEGGGTVIVNRGFVPTERRDPATRAAGQAAGPVALAGLIRFPEPRGLFAAADDAGRRIFYTRDIAAIAAAMGLPGEGTAPFLIDAEGAAAPGGLPQPGETRLVFPNRHLEYALTWYGLALTLVGVFLAFAAQRLRVRPPEP